MLQHRITNGSSSGRKQQTALKQTVDRQKIPSWHNNRNHPYSSSSTIPNHQLINQTKSSTKIFDDNPELDLTCQEETLTEAQLQNYPSQVNISNFLY